MNTRRHLLLTLLSLLPGAAVSCKAGFGETREWREANRRWEKNRPARYKMVVSVSILTTPGETPPKVYTVVQNGQVVQSDVVYTRGGRPSELPPAVRADLIAAHGTVERLFAHASAQAKKDFDKECTYDARFGYPASIKIRFKPGMANVVAPLGLNKPSEIRVEQFSPF